MRKEGIKSPDLIDAMAMAFHEDATFYVADEVSSEQPETLETTINKVSDLFADA